MNYFKRFVIPTIAGVFILFFSACVNTDYDLDDEHLDKNIVLSPDGVNLPVGNLESIILYDEVKKHYDELKISPDGGLYTEFKGNFDVEIPVFDPIQPTVVDIDPIKTTDPYIAINDFNLPAEVTIADKKSDIFSIKQPVQENGEWNFSIRKIEFTTCQLKIQLAMKGITFEGSSAQMNLELKLPEGITVKDGGSNTVSRQVPLINFNGGTPYTIKVDVDTYTFDKDSTYTYSAKITNGIGTKVKSANSNDFEFDLSITTEEITPKILRGSVKASEEIAGEPIDISSFYSAFDASDIFNFTNPQLDFKLKTNLGINFDVGGTISGGADNNVSITPALAFSKPLAETGANAFKETNYWLSPIQPDGVNDIFWRDVALDKFLEKKPQTITYNFSLNAQKAGNPDAYFLYDGTSMTADYTLKVPLVFNQLEMNVSDTIENVFPKEVSDIFEKMDNSSYLEIAADSVDVILGKTASSASVKVTVSATVLDENKQKLDVDIDPVELKYGLTQKLVIRINGEDKEGMKNAKHLSFKFTIQGGTTALPLVLGQNDYIHIKKLRLISSDGYPSEL